MKYLNQVLLDPLYSNKGQAYENMGLASTQTIATIFDGMARHIDVDSLAFISIDGLYRAMGEAGLVSRMLLSVHDELVFEVQAGQEQELERMVRQHMRGAADLEVELVVDVGVGDNWDEAH